MNTPSSELIHPTWRAILAQLHRAGILRDLEIDRVGHLLGAAAAQEVNAAALFALLESYYHAEGDWVEALWRRQGDRVVQCSENASPADVAEQLSQVLQPLRSLSAGCNSEALVLETERGQVGVSRVVRHARLASRSRRAPDTSVAAVFRGANALLAQVGYRRRFVQLRGPASTLIFAAVGPAHLKALSMLNLLEHREPSQLMAFTGWTRLPGNTPTHNHRSSRTA